MSDTPKKQRLPNFDDKTQEWIVNTLATMPAQMATDIFLQCFEEYNHPRYGTPEEIRKIVLNRFQKAKSDKSRPIYERIQKRKKEIEYSLLDSFPLANPITQMVELHNTYFHDDLTTEQKSRIRTEALKLARIIKEYQNIHTASKN